MDRRLEFQIQFPVLLLAATSRCAAQQSNQGAADPAISHKHATCRLPPCRAGRELRARKSLGKKAKKALQMSAFFAGCRRGALEKQLKSKLDLPRIVGTVASGPNFTKGGAGVVEGVRNCNHA